MQASCQTSLVVYIDRRLVIAIELYRDVAVDLYVVRAKLAQRRIYIRTRIMRIELLDVECHE
jgi:hypothetical protein